LSQSLCEAPGSCPERWRSLKPSKAGPHTATALAIAKGIVLVGRSGAGKTELIRPVTDRVQTLGRGFNQCEMVKSVDNKHTVKFLLYDLAGDDLFANRRLSYYRYADIVLLCVDLSDLNFNAAEVEKEMQKVEEERKVAGHTDKCRFFLIGTKGDLIEDCEDVDISSISKWADENSIEFFKTSTKKGGDHIQILFNKIADICVRMELEKKIQLQRRDCIRRGGAGGCCVWPAQLKDIFSRSAR